MKGQLRWTPDGDSQGYKLFYVHRDEDHEGMWLVWTQCNNIWGGLFIILYRRTHTRPVPWWWVCWLVSDRERDTFIPSPPPQTNPLTTPLVTTQTLCSSPFGKCQQKQQQQHTNWQGWRNVVLRISCRNGMERTGTGNSNLLGDCFLRASPSKCAMFVAEHRTALHVPNLLKFNLFIHWHNNNNPIIVAKMCLVLVMSSPKSGKDEMGQTGAEEATEYRFIVA